MTGNLAKERFELPIIHIFYRKVFFQNHVTFNKAAESIDMFLTPSQQFSEFW